MGNKVKKSKDEEFFDDCDDCEICKVMKKGQGGNYGDLMEAFAKQNAKNKFNEKIGENKK